MKIVVIGGTGLIGSKAVAILRRGGHTVIAASPQTGINTITGQGLKDAMASTQVVVDLANSPASAQLKDVHEAHRLFALLTTLPLRQPSCGFAEREEPR